MNNRDITLYTLDLPPETREEVRRFAETNVLPENRNYYYHHFKDNCSTRIRDILDLATGGQFREAFGEAPSPFTLRQQVRRHTWFSPFFDWLLNFLMGQDIDVPITAWEEMFLPQAVGNYIRDFSYTDARGLERKLVSDVEILNRAVNRPPVLERPRRQWIRELAFGLVIAVLLVFLQFYRKKYPGSGGVLWGLVQTLLGLFFGIVGTVLFFMTFFTDHDYTWHNINVLFVNPLWFAVAVWGIRSAAARSAEKRARPEFLLKCFWTAAGILCFLTMPVKLLPFFYQQNQVTQALFLPIALVLGWFPKWFQISHRRIRPGSAFLFLLLAFPCGAQVPQGESSGIPFPLSPVLEAVQTGAGRWRPDWPLEIPPDAFTVPDAAAIELDLGEPGSPPGGPVSYRLEWAGDRLTDFPLALPAALSGARFGIESGGPPADLSGDLPGVPDSGPLFVQVHCRYDEAGGLAGLDIDPPAGITSGSFVISFDPPCFPQSERASGARISYGDRLYLVLLSGGIHEITETWFDSSGVFAAYVTGRIEPVPPGNLPSPQAPGASPAPGGLFPWRILGLEGSEYGGDAGEARPLRSGRTAFQYESGGSLSEHSGEQGFFSAVYGPAGRPRYWIRGARNYSFQWDEGGRLVRMQDLGAVGGGANGFAGGETDSKTGGETDASPVDFRYDYEYDSRNNWVLRRETALFRAGNLLLPASYRELVRRIVYKGETDGSLD
jgi:hypothetical protein